MNKTIGVVFIEQFVEEELAKIDKRIKWAERRSRWGAILWIVVIIMSVVFVGLGLRDIAFSLLFIAILIMALVKSETSFIEGFLAGKYYMSVKGAVDNNTNEKGE